jgi:hypothetical protein
LLNAPFLLAQSKAFAQRLRKEASDDPGRIDAAFRLAFGRAPTAAERKTCLAFLEKQTRRIADAGDKSGDALADLCQVLLNANEFVYVD